MWEKEVIFHDGETYFLQLKQAISDAKKSIFLEVYIFDLDQVGNIILELLASAAARGLDVKLLIDGVGAPQWTYYSAEVWRKRGVAIKFFHALPWQKHPYKVWQTMGLQKIILGYFKLRHRNHRKVCIIDNDIMFIGSHNITQVHLHGTGGIVGWRDTSALLRGPEIKRYVEAFLDTWQFAQKFYGQRWEAVRRRKKESHQMIVQKIKSAKSRVWVTNPYFVPDFKLLKAICTTARTGVSVKILLPKHIDIFGLKFAVEALYTLLLSFKVEIYEYLPSMMHAKILIIDDWVCIGSSNLDFRSIYNNLEGNAIITMPHSVAAVEEQFKLDLVNSKKVDLQQWKKRSWLMRKLERFFLFFRDIL